jgi:dynactin complex subunit
MWRLIWVSVNKNSSIKNDNTDNKIYKDIFSKILKTIKNRVGRILKTCQCEEAGKQSVDFQTVGRGA